MNEHPRPGREPRPRPVIEAFPRPGRRVEYAYRELDTALHGSEQEKKSLGNHAFLARPWDPSTCLDQQLRAEVWHWLDRVVTWINHDYVWDAAGMIPSCWPQTPPPGPRDRRPGRPPPQRRSRSDWPSARRMAALLPSRVRRADAAAHQVPLRGPRAPALARPRAPHPAPRAGFCGRASQRLPTRPRHSRNRTRPTAASGPTPPARLARARRPGDRRVVVVRLMLLQGRSGTRLWRARQRDETARSILLGATPHCVTWQR